MKKIFTFIVLLIITKLSLAQAPKEINYQGVARNAQGQAIANQTIKVRASLLKSDAVDNTLQFITFYTETRTITTNPLGLFSFKINDAGSATKTGDFNEGQWLTATTSMDQYLKIELDVNNSGTWTDMGTQKLVSVPYALYAGEALVAHSLRTPSVAFHTSSTTSQTIASNTTGKITFESLEPSSLGFNTTTSAFTASNTGMHHFDGVVSGQLSQAIQNPTFIYLQILVNGNIKKYFRYQILPNMSSIECSFSLNMHLNKNDVVTVALENKLVASLLIGNESTYFNGNNIH